MTPTRSLTSPPSWPSRSRSPATSFHLSYQALLTADDAVLLLAVDGQERLGYLLGFQHLTFYANGPVAWVDETPGCRAHFAAMADPRAHAGLPG